MVGGGSPACPGRVHTHQRCSSPDLGRLGFQGIGEAHPFVFKELMVLILWRVEVGGKGGRIHHTCFHTGRICYVPQEGHRLALWGLRGSSLSLGQGPPMLGRVGSEGYRSGSDQ